MTSGGRTIGISPKLILAVIGAVLGYLVTQELVDFPGWGDLVIMCALVGIGAFTAGPGVVTGATHDPSPPQ